MFKTERHFETSLSDKLYKVCSLMLQIWECTSTIKLCIFLCRPEVIQNICFIDVLLVELLTFSPPNSLIVYQKPKLL